MHARLRLAALATAPLLVLTGCGGDDRAGDDPTPAGGTTSSSPTGPDDEPTTAPAEPTDAATGGTTDGATDAAGATTVPTYFAGVTPQGVRLYREFHRVEGDALQAAADLVTEGGAGDPDYRTLWPGGTFASVASDGSAIVATVADDAWSAPGELSRNGARLAVQQLVYTLQGVAQERLPVRVVTADGTPAPLFGIEGDLTQAPPLDVLALVNVTVPEEGATVSGSFEASGVASSFEANVPWQVRDSDGRTVVEGFATAEGWMDKLYPWRAEVDVSGLEPGTYTFVAMTDDPSGGEGSGPTEDTKTFRVG